jgi:hypothetical protein
VWLLLLLLLLLLLVVCARAVVVRPGLARRLHWVREACRVRPACPFPEMVIGGERRDDSGDDSAVES